MGVDMSVCTLVITWGVDDVTKPVRERVRMRAVEIDDVAAIDYIN